METNYILSEATVLSAANVPRLLAIWQRGVNRNPLAALSQGETPLQQWARNINKGKVRLPLNCRAMTNICWLGKNLAMLQFGSTIYSWLLTRKKERAIPSISSESKSEEKKSSKPLFGHQSMLFLNFHSGSLPLVASSCLT